MGEKRSTDDHLSIGDALAVLFVLLFFHPLGWVIMLFGLALLS